MSETDMHGIAFARPEEKAHPNAWMLSFADLLSLMLTFFILLFAMSEIRMKEWHEVTTSLQDKLNPGHVVMRFEEEQPKAQPVVPTERSSLNLSYVLQLLEEKLGTRFGNNVVIEQFDDRIVVTLKNNSLFQAGDATFSKDGLPIVKEVSNAVAKLSSKIEVNGHTDPRPISTQTYPSNWELSLARADAVARLIKGAGYERPIETLGMAASRYNTSHADKKEDARMALARRVDIIIRETKDF